MKLELAQKLTSLCKNFYDVKVIEELQIDDKVTSGISEIEPIKLLSLVLIFTNEFLNENNEPIFKELNGLFTIVDENNKIIIY